MEIIGVQFDIEWENREANYKKVSQALASESINGKGDGLIILPEMFSSGFSMNVATVAETAENPSEQFMSQLAGETGCAVLGGLVTTKENGRGRNELAVMDPEGKQIARYQKNRTFRYTNESDSYDNGTEVIVFDWAGWNHHMVKELLKSYKENTQE